MRGSTGQDVPDMQISKDTFQDYKRRVINNNQSQLVKSLQSPFGETWSDGNSALGSSMLLGDPNQTEFNTTYGSDLKQAYSESVFAVSEDVGQEHVHASVQAYRHGRDCMDTTPLEKQEAERILYGQEQQNVHDGMERANYYANQQDNMHVKQELFWSKMKRLK